MLPFLFLAFVASAAADCSADTWQNWGECKNSASCQTPLYKDLSWHEPATPYDEEAHYRMLDSMRRKEEHGIELGKCRREGTCPERMPAPSSFNQDCVDGMAGTWPCHNVHMDAHISVEDLGYDWVRTGDANPRGNDIWGWVDPQDQSEYVIIGLTGASTFVRIDNPQNPEVLGILYGNRMRATTWRDMKVRNDHVYIGSEVADHGMQVFDLTRLRGLTHDPTREFVEDALYMGVGQSHNIVYNEGADYIYIVGSRHGNYPNICAGGLHIVDVSEPANPQFVACWGEDGYVHDAECVIYDGPDQDHQGSEICVCYNENSLTIVDTTDKQNIRMLSRSLYEGSQYTHQGWFSKDKRYALMDDELDESRAPAGLKQTRTLIWDVSDLDNPSLVDSFYSQHEAIDHNQYIRDDYVYQSNYRSGLQLLHFNTDLPIPRLTNVGEFDCHPSDTSANFGGTWSNYPYFPSGTVALASQEEGLFLLRPDWDAIESELAMKTAPSYQTRYRNVLGIEDREACPLVAERRVCHDPVNTC